MITFTKEQLIASAHARIEFAEMMLAGELEPLKERTWSIELELARIALASLEAEHAGFIVKHKITGKFGSWLHSKADWFRSDEYEVLSAYTAPPATVSMKDHQIRDLVNELRDISVEYHGTQQLRERIARTIRAAMLQGAELVTTANKLPFEQWLSQQTGTIDVECGCVMTEVFFHWLRVAYEAGNYPVIPDGWVLVPIEPTYQMCEAMGLQWESPRFPDRYKAMLAAVKK
ncbi:hypothetical protein [Enterobacter hormaechei]|uniref:hypothetical protein n=1 Tax=Enterobacter hormaechei TaxID=158836 RepID=UPI002FD59444